MPSQVVETLVNGGQATAAPPLGPALGPLGVNIGQVVADINKVTAAFKGMSVPVKVTVDMDTKQFSIVVGTPPASQLIIKEVGIQKGSGRPNQDLVGDLKIEQVIKISQMKDTALLGATRKAKVLEIVGTCQSMGVMVEGMPAPKAIAEIRAGKYDKKIASEKTELSVDELKELEVEQKHLKEELEKKRVDHENLAKATAEEMKGKPAKEIRKRMQELHIPEQIIDEFIPKDEEKKEAPKK
ncbi:50S ribosomal protein L11 [Candidatus Woesearchaeota archaeon CG_4_10_14_0_2_um_filter_57_5]|nr:MAG: 50S ribosomal protein L11 [Candidatus Woesearchaeota archaeon CG1_02_57_44]PIZ54134.1 MAG: 50S ribosomal protein L11 [Candidatus Woesearchaeota archaeon CG_4_10_14_0_2_um_filter_57_5]